MKELQEFVFRCIERRGYGVRPGETPEGYTTRQYLKASEEMGEVARHVFDGHAPPVEEIADVVIPLLAMAEALGYDVGAAIREKVEDDVRRGVR